MQTLSQLTSQDHCVRCLILHLCALLHHLNPAVVCVAAPSGSSSCVCATFYASIICVCCHTTLEPSIHACCCLCMQLEGLSWMVSQHQRGLNSILADEMVRDSPAATLSCCAVLYSVLRGVVLLCCCRESWGLNQMHSHMHARPCHNHSHATPGTSNI